MAEHSRAVVYEERDFDTPIRLQSDVVHGFKRGSKELGFPTANMNMEAINDIVDAVSTGIYFGWARVRGSVHPAVVSIGWNPYYKNQHKTVVSRMLGT